MASRRRVEVSIQKRITIIEAQPELFSEEDHAWLEEQRKTVPSAESPPEAEVQVG